ncbi:MAG: hypothetical protein AAF449_11155 [Myxococcota bacterium]
MPEFFRRRAFGGKVTFMSLRSIAGLPAFTIGFAVTLGSCPSVEAHRFQHPKDLTLTLERRKISMDLHFRWNAGARTLRIRSAFDRDTNGRLDPTEQRSLQAFLLGRALRGLRVRIDGQSVALHAQTSELLDAHRRVDDGRPLQLTARFLLSVIEDREGLRIEISDDAPQRQHVPVSIRYSSSIWTVQQWSKTGPIAMNAVRPFAVYRQNPLRIEARLAKTF